MMKSPLRESIGRWMLAVLLVAYAPLAANGAARAQSDAKTKTKLSTVPSSSGIDVPKIPYTRFVLPNGLVVIVNEDHSAPVAAIDLSYHVGSKDEIPGKRGLAHLFEHMMFEGSAHLEPGEYARIIQESGGTYGGATDNDRTRFPTNVPSNMLETVLWLEAERMAFLPARLDSTRFERGRDAVINEYGQTFIGAPASRSLGPEAIVNGLFPDLHPYHVTPIGDIGELKKMTVSDLRAFFDRYYVPNNAVLAISGDVKTAEVRTLVEKYFGGIPKKATVNHPAVPLTKLTQEKRLVLEDRVSNAALLWLAWPGVASKDPDRMALTALSGILTSGSTSRLQRTLIGEQKLATFFSPTANQHFDLENAGIFQIVIVAKANDPMTGIERVTDSVIASIRDAGIQTAELRRWRARFIVGTDTSLQTARDKALVLDQDELFKHNPVASLADIDAANRLTPADIQRVARKYLVPEHIVMSVVPAGKLNLISKPSEPYVNVTKPKTP